MLDRNLKAYSPWRDIFDLRQVLTLLGAGVEEPAILPAITESKLSPYTVSANPEMLSEI